MAGFDLTRWRRPAGIVAGIVLMATLLAWLMGAFRHRLAPVSAPAIAIWHVDAAAPRYKVALASVPRTETAVGSIRAVHETQVAARLLGRIRVLTIERAGQMVQQGEVLAELESADLTATVEQARAARKAAQAQRDRLQLDLSRTRELVTSGVASQARLDQDQAAFAAAQAELERAEQVLTGAESALGFATVRAPIGGIVVDKKVSLGDVVLPGQVLCTLYDPTRLQLVASVREELAGRLTVGQDVDVTLDALGKSCRGTVSEVVPQAQARTRSFEVKVTGPCQPGAVTGMFGRLHVPLGTRDELRVPARALVSVGQLDFVYVAGAGDTVARRYVRLGRRSEAEAQAEAQVEVLAGLEPGEVVIADALAVRAP